MSHELQNVSYSAHHHPHHADQAASSGSSSAATGMRSSGPPPCSSNTLDNRVWVQESVPSSELPAFCEELQAVVRDKGLRLKLYLDGPNVQRWLMGACSNSALVCALVFASTFSSFSNMDLYNIAGAASGQALSNQYGAHTCYFLLLLSIFLSACGIGLCTVSLNLMPQTARATAADTIGFLSRHEHIVFAASFIVPVLAVLPAVLCVVVWCFLVYRSSFAITVACVAGTMILLFALAFSSLVKDIVGRVDAFERLVQDRKLEEAFLALTDLKVRPAARSAMARVRAVHWPKD